MAILRIISKSIFFILIAGFAILLPSVAHAVRLKDIADVEGVRGNQLVGYGLVIGLQGTGDKRGSFFTTQSVSNFLEHLGIRVNPTELRLSNVAAVLVTGTLPPFARTGSKMDVTLSSIGDASTLQGGVLLMTPLRGADGKVYAVAQGSVSIGGFSVSQGGDSAQKNHPTVGIVAKGATVERVIPFDLFASGQIRIVLRDPDFVTVTRVQEVVNAFLGNSQAKAIDSASVSVTLGHLTTQNPVELVAKLEQLDVKPDTPARVVVNERTGTIIMGESVRIATVALAHGNLNITIKSESQVSQPNPLAAGDTAVVNQTDVNVTEDKGQLSVISQSVSIGDLVKALNGLGATPRDMIAIFQALQKAGALQAELVIM